jgi:hypothetical protein
MKTLLGSLHFKDEKDETNVKQSLVCDQVVNLLMSGGSFHIQKFPQSAY